MKTHISKLALIVVALILAGCQTSLKRQETVVTVPPTYGENVPIPKVAPTDLKELKWKLMNRAEMQKFLDDHKGEDFDIYTLDGQNAAILIGNIQELRRYIQSQEEVIAYLKKVLDARSEKGDK